jgi:phosphatidylglycerol:prolipoprotein diacylglycerol transferase
VHPIAFNFGPLPVYSYGVMMALAFLAGLWTAGRRAPRDGIAGEKILDLGPWLIAGAIVGARIFYVVSYWREQFAGKPLMEIFLLRHGGLVYYGGLIGASLGCIVYVRVRKLALWRVADILAPSIALGYVFGRIGCLLNGCCYGRVCNLPWAIRFPNQSFAWRQQFDFGLVGQTDPSLPVHPTEIYDSLLNLGLYGGLALLYRHKRFDGQVFATYLIGYALTRSFVETFRGDYSAEHIHGGLTPAHLVSIAILLAGLVLFWVLSRQPNRG